MSLPNPPGPKSPACPLKVDPKWLFFPHKGMFRSIWAQVSRFFGRKWPEEWKRDTLPRGYPWVPGVKTPGNAHDKRPAGWIGPGLPWKPLKLGSKCRCVAGRICLGGYFFFVLTAISCNLQWFGKEYPHPSVGFLFCRLESCRFFLVLPTPPSPFCQTYISSNIMPVIAYLILP